MPVLIHAKIIGTIPLVRMLKIPAIMEVGHLKLPLNAKNLLPQTSIFAMEAGKLISPNNKPYHLPLHLAEEESIMKIIMFM